MIELITLNLAESFATFGGLAALNVMIVNLITTQFNIQTGWVKQMLSWLIPISVSIVGFLLNLGLFTVYNDIAAWQGWLYTILTGFGIGLTSNGIFDIAAVKTLLNYAHTIAERFKPKKTEE